MSLTKQVLVSDTVVVHYSAMGKVKAGKFFCVCAHCDHRLQSECLEKGCWCCAAQVMSATR
ncbi:hypothetical protein E6H26_05890 [Candidatus Bathyarchaeota archaeon]|nr:MAG: hypothetical protein E6H26_05890 [Candidatus Bathyarchaeota archaeon]